MWNRLHAMWKIRPVAHSVFIKSNGPEERLPRTAYGLCGLRLHG